MFVLCFVTPLLWKRKKMKRDAKREFKSSAAVNDGCKVTASM